MLTEYNQKAKNNRAMAAVAIDISLKNAEEKFVVPTSRVMV